MSVVNKTLLNKPLLRGLQSLHNSQRSRSTNMEYHKFMFNLSGFNRYGLYFHDVYGQRLPEVVEAIRRLPEEEQMAKKQRALRAHQLLITHTELPECEWTKYDDPYQCFLAPYLEEIIAEWKEREEWDASH